METIIFHIDVNSAFLSWTALEDLKSGEALDIRTIPAIIGGDRKSRHGVVLAKSLPAKKYKIKTGEPITNALKKCPSLVIKPPTHGIYEEYSHRLMEFLHTITPDIEQLSIDECYLDFTGIAHLYESPAACAVRIKDEISNNFGFTVNIGISTNKLLAKMASDFEKPNLVHTLFPHEITEKMWPMPVSELYMAGKSSVATLNNLGIFTIGDLAASDPKLLSLHLKSHGNLLWNYANGIGDTIVNGTPQELKGIGNSITLAADAETASDAKLVLRNLAETVSERLRSNYVLAGNICVEIKYSTFVSVSHQMQLDTPTDTNHSIYRAACLLFDRLWDQTPIRLLGIRSSKLIDQNEPVQLSLFDFDFEKEEKNRRLDNALDEIRKKYGVDSVTRGSLF